MKKLLHFLPALLLTTTLVQGAENQTQQEPKTRKFNVPQTQQQLTEQQNLQSSRILTSTPP